MAESLKYKRAIFLRGKQREFLLLAKKNLNLTWSELADVLEVSVKSLYGWRQEKISMSLDCVQVICKRSNIKFPQNVEIKDRYWYVTKGAVKGGLAVYKKYGKVGGDERTRKERWKKWWEKEGKFKKHSITNSLPITKPNFSSELAEFVGIVLGDGGISKRQITITLHRVTDKKYSQYITKLITRLFKVKVGIYKSRKYLADDLILSRTELVKYCVKTLGLKEGNKVKNRVDIPDWIKNNKEYYSACLRGLIDTDGCVILHKYKVNGKSYCYKKLAFTSRSYPLLESVGNILTNLGIKHRITNDGFDIRIEAKDDVNRYLSMVGFNNPKHLKRLRK